MRSKIIDLIENKLKWNEEDIKEYYSSGVLMKNGLGRVAKEIGVYKSLNIAYPGRFKPWELKCVPRNFWKDKNNVALALRDLIENKLKWDREQVIRNFNAKLLYDNGLSILTNYYGLYECLNIAYPNEYRTEDFTRNARRKISK